MTIFEPESDDELNRLRIAHAHLLDKFASVAHNSKTTYKRYLKQVELTKALADQLVLVNLELEKVKKELKNG